MKVFFLIGNYYIHAEPYSRIALLLKNEEIQTNLYYIGESIEGVDESLDFAKIIRKTNTRELPIFCLNTKPGFINRPLQFIRLVLNKYLLKYFLHREKPDLVVVGGDIANMNTRLFLHTCHLMGINVLMVPITEAGKLTVNPAPDKNVPMAGTVRFVLRFFGLEETVFFRGWVLGSYHKRGVIAVPNRQLMQDLLDNGIQKERLVEVAGRPSYDLIYDVLQRPLDRIKAEVSSVVGFECTKDLRLVVYCTEVMQAIYGIEYVMNINHLLSDAFDALPENVKVVIKIHPREVANVVALHKKAFCGDRFYYVISIDNYALLRAADVVISFWSTMLIDAALLKTPVLSIRLIEDNAPIIFGRTSEFTHITSEKDFQTKIWRTFFDRSFRDTGARFISQWKDSNGIVIDGRCCERITELIKVQIFSGITN